MSTQQPESHVRTVGEAPSADCRTIQAAHDDLPEDDSDDYRGSGLILVDGSYDSAHEEFPIRITKYLDVRGQSRTSSRIVSDDPETDVIRFERRQRRGNRTPIKRFRISNLAIRGGRDAVVIDGHSYFSANFLTVLDAARDGIAAVDDGGVFGSYFERCYVRNCGRTGFSFHPSTMPHGVVMIRCSATGNGGIGAHLSGFGANVLGGAYQVNDGPGIVIEGAGNMGSGAVGLHNNYIEYNGQARTDARDVVLGDGVRGAKLDNCYLTGYNEDVYDEAETHAAIESRDNADCEVDHCTFRGYHWCDEAGLFDVSDDSTNVELNLGTHHRFHGAEEADTFLRRPATFYTNGVRHGDDPTAAPGRYDGEPAYSEGVSYVWSASHDEWLEG